jgi:hypothetical protein
MKTEKDLNQKRKDALFAYLELCNIGEIVPEKRVYDELASCTDPEILDNSICQIKSGLLEIEKAKANVEKEIQRKREGSIIRQILNIFK